MPRTTSAISERDLEVLDFVARFGLVPSSAVGTWARTAQTVTYARQRRWVERGLVQLIEPINGSGRLLVCTREGLRAVGRDGLGTGRVSVGRRPHAIVVAQVGATLERDGHVGSQRARVGGDRGSGAPPPLLGRAERRTVSSPRSGSAQRRPGDRGGT